jgi:NAD(P)H-dependent FMN reductase
VKDIRTQLQISDGVLISSPEYAHGIPGVLKNALDWVVGSGELYRKPVALLNASPRDTCTSFFKGNTADNGCTYH